MFRVSCLFGPGIWAFDPYGLTGKIQHVAPASGVKEWTNIHFLKP